VYLPQTKWAAWWGNRDHAGPRTRGQLSAAAGGKSVDFPLEAPRRFRGREPAPDAPPETRLRKGRERRATLCLHGQSGRRSPHRHTRRSAHMEMGTTYKSSWTLKGRLLVLFTTSRLERRGVPCEGRASPTNGRWTYKYEKRCGGARWAPS